MANNRYRYDRNGKLMWFSSDSSPLQRGCANVALISFIPFVLLLIIASILFPNNDKKLSTQHEESHSETYEEIDNNDHELDYNGMVPKEDVEPSYIVEAVGETPNAERNTQTSYIENDDEAVPLDKIEVAMQEAFEKGQPIRWKGDSLKGYAVPSDVQAETGCRSIYYSIDSYENWQSPIREYCP